MKELNPDDMEAILYSTVVIFDAGAELNSFRRLINVVSDGIK